MLSIAQNASNLFCIEWIPTELGPQAVKYKKVQLSSDSQFKNFLDDVLVHFKSESDNSPKTLTLSLDIENVAITSFYCDPEIPVDEYISWYEKRILGEYIVQNYDIYYYPLGLVENLVMVFYISKTKRQNILKSCNKNSYQILHLTLDIFSANYASKIYGSSKCKNYIIWKISNNNYHYLINIQNGELKHYMKFKKTTKIECIQFVGEQNFQSKLEKLCHSLLFKSRGNIDIVDKVFLYQTKSESTLIKKLVNKNKKIVLMDIKNNLLDKKSNHKNANYSLLCYNENGNSLRGIDV